MAVSWLWVGACTPDGATVTARLDGTATSCRLAVSTRPDMADPVYSAATGPDGDHVRLTISGLEPSTRYWCQVEIDSVIDTDHTGRFRTVPPVLEPASFSIAHASCNFTGSTHLVWDSLATHRPDVFFHLGDIHYENISTNDVGLYLDAFDENMASDRFRRVAAAFPWVYVWDDHDFGPDNSNGDGAYVPAANSAYRTAVPHYEIPDTTGIWQSFGIGRVWFIATDLRSFRSPNDATDNASKSMLGTTQKAWFKAEVTDARDAGYQAIVWLNTQVWPAETGVETTLGNDPDHWGAFGTERAELSQFLVDESIEGLMILSGDMHSCAYKLGADPAGVGASVDVFQAAALDQTGNTRGVGWHAGPSAGGGRYGRLRVTDDGSNFQYEWSAVAVDASTGVHTVLFSVLVGAAWTEMELVGGDSQVPTVTAPNGSHLLERVPA